MKKYTDHTYADCLDPKNHHKAAHRLIKPQHTNEVSHTPTPMEVLQVDDGHYGIFRNYGNEAQELIAQTFDGNEKENAELIVRAVNAHEELLQLVKDLNYAFYVKGTSQALRPLMAKTKELIAKAEGK